MLCSSVVLLLYFVCKTVGLLGGAHSWGGGGVTPLFGLYGDVPLDRVWFFGLAVQFDLPLS